MDIRQLRYFAEVALVQNFRTAANRLNISQSSLSRRVADLEGSLGVQLFERHPRGVTLSRQGQMLFERTSALLRDIEIARAEVTGGQLTGAVTVGTSDAVSRTLLAPLAAAFAGPPPSVSLRFVEGPQYVLFEGLDAGRIDLAVMTTPEPIASCRMEVILQEPLHLIMRDDERPEKHQLEIEDLDRIPLVMFPRPSGNRNYLERKARERGAALDCRYEVSSTSAQREFVMARLAHCILPYSAVAEQVGPAGLAAIPIADLALTRTMVWRADRHQAPVVQQVAHVVRELMVARRPPRAILPGEAATP